MAGLSSTITIQEEYRPCKVKNKQGDKKALFHRWNEVAQIRDAIMMGTTSGQMKDIFAIVEYEDGTVDRVYPYDIQFLDGKFREYAFPE